MWLLHHKNLILLRLGSILSIKRLVLIIARLILNGLVLIITLLLNRVSHHRLSVHAVLLLILHLVGFLHHWVLIVCKLLLRD